MVQAMCRTWGDVLNMGIEKHWKVLRQATRRAADLAAYLMLLAAVGVEPGHPAKAVNKPGQA